MDNLSGIGSDRIGSASLNGFLMTSEKVHLSAVIALPHSTQLLGCCGPKGRGYLGPITD